MSVLAKRTYKPADERREQILACALETFANKGYHGSSIADVCARAGIGRATLYQYFEDKRDLLVALADRVEKRVADAVTARRPIEAQPDVVVTEDAAVAFVTHRFAGVLSAIFHDAPTTRLVLRAGRGADGVVDEMLARLDARILALIEADLSASVDAGWLRPIDVTLVARFFLGGAEKVVLMYIDEGRPLDVHKIAHEAALLELTGILARSALSPTLTPTASAAKPPKARRKS